MRLSVIVAFDENYAQHAAVTITSLFRNTRTPIDLWIMYNEEKMSLKTKNKINSLTSHSKFDNRIIWHSMDMSAIADARTCNYWSMEVWFSLFVPEVCTTSRALYLDVDTVVLGDLTDFYNQNINDYYAVVVPDHMIYWQIKMGLSVKLPDGTSCKTEEYMNRVVGLESPEKVLNTYFNTGVLLMNLDKMRRDGISLKLRETMSNGGFAFVDQDCFNIVLRGKVKYAPIDYNYTFYVDYLLDVLPNKEADNLRPYFEKKKRPQILHFTNKPWKFHNVLFSEYYWKYLLMTPWRHRLLVLFPTFRELRRWLVRIHMSPRHPKLKLFGLNLIGPKDRARRWDPYKRDCVE